MNSNQMYAHGKIQSYFKRECILKSEIHIKQMHIAFENIQCKQKHCKRIRDKTKRKRGQQRQGRQQSVWLAISTTWE